MTEPGLLVRPVGFYMDHFYTSQDLHFWDRMRTGKMSRASELFGVGDMAASYNVTIIQKPTYLHAIVTGLNTRENVMSYLGAVSRECALRDCSRVLIEERLEGPRLGVMDVYEIAEAGSGRALGSCRTIAYVDVNAEGDLMRFAETVAANRFLFVKVFPSVGDAEKWLLSADR